MFAPVNPRSAVPGTWGKIKVSRSELVARKVARRGQGRFFPEPAIPLALTSNLPNNVSNAMLAVERSILPPTITKWIETAGLKEDWKTHCSAVVFCSFIQNDAGERMRGFVIEDNETAALTGKRFLTDPSTTIFINHYISLESREMLMEHEFFPHLVYYLGHLKAGVDLETAGIDPDSTRHELRSFYAAMYELDAISKLMCALVKAEGEEPAIVRADAGGKWLAATEEQLKASFESLGDTEKAALYRHRLIPDQLPLGIKLPEYI